MNRIETSKVQGAQQKSFRHNIPQSGFKSSDFIALFERFWMVLALVSGGILFFLFVIISLINGRTI
jgi:hypothetical protein